MNYPYPTDILSIVPREKDGWQHGRSLVKFSLTSSLKNAVPAAFFILPEKRHRPGKKAGIEFFQSPAFSFKIAPPQTPKILFFYKTHRKKCLTDISEQRNRHHHKTFIPIDFPYFLASRSYYWVGGIVLIGLAAFRSYLKKEGKIMKFTNKMLYVVSVVF